MSFYHSPKMTAMVCVSPQIFSGFLPFALQAIAKKNILRRNLEKFESKF
jgi:hypothetical protein